MGHAVEGQFDHNHGELHNEIAAHQNRRHDYLDRNQHNHPEWFDESAMRSQVDWHHKHINNHENRISNHENRISHLQNSSAMQVSDFSSNAFSELKKQVTLLRLAAVIGAGALIYRFW